MQNSSAAIRVDKAQKRCPRCNSWYRVSFERVELIYCEQKDMPFVKMTIHSDGSGKTVNDPGEAGDDANAPGLIAVVTVACPCCNEPFVEERMMSMIAIEDWLAKPKAPPPEAFLREVLSGSAPAVYCIGGDFYLDETEADRWLAGTKATPCVRPKPTFPPSMRRARSIFDVPPEEIAAAHREALDAPPRSRAPKFEGTMK